MNERLQKRQQYFESVPKFQTVTGMIVNLQCAADGSASLFIKSQSDEMTYLEIMNKSKSLDSTALINLAVQASVNNLAVSVGYDYDEELVILMNLA